MAVLNRIAEFEPELRAWRRHLHTIPELDFDLFDTATFVAARLRDIGIDEIHEGIARTGIVALIRGRAPGPVVGLRADMDELPILEAVDRPWEVDGGRGRCTPAGTTGTPRSCSARRATSPRPGTSLGPWRWSSQPSEEMSGGGRGDGPRKA